MESAIASFFMFVLTFYIGRIDRKRYESFLDNGWYFASLVWLSFAIHLLGDTLK